MALATFCGKNTSLPFPLVCVSLARLPVCAICDEGRLRDAGVGLGTTSSWLNDDVEEAPGEGSRVTVCLDILLALPPSAAMRLCYTYRQLR